MALHVPPPWQYSVYSPLMNAASVLYPSVRRARDKNPPYPERFAAIRGQVPDSIRAIAANAPHGTLWVHGVSVGEALAAGPLVSRWATEGVADVPLIFTTTTNGGYKLAHRNFPDGTPITFFPFDATGPVRRVFEALKPRVLVIYETELWPTTIREAHRRGVKTLLANARISDRAAEPPKVSRSLMEWMYGSLDAIMPQSDIDHRRLLALGVREEQLLPDGNVKFDAAGDPPSPEARLAGRAALGIDVSAPVFVAGSTHPGEEGPVMEAVERVRLASRGLICLLAPRHLARLPEVETLLKSRNHAYRTLSDIRATGPHADQPQTILVDTLGDLVGLYGLADCAFVGGSLIARGGHNILEPAAQGCPVLHGPHMHNFRSLVYLLTMAEAAQLVTEESLAHHIREVLGDPVARAAWRERALAAVAQGKGATGRLIEWINGAMGESD